MVKKKVSGGWKVKGVDGTYGKRRYKSKQSAERHERVVARAKKRVRHTRRKR